MRKEIVMPTRNAGTLKKQPKIITEKIENIIPYDKNPRVNKNAIDAVAKSIKQYGFQQPIVVDKNNVIIVGHTRLFAAIELGIKEVPVIIAKDLTDVEARAYRIADNKTNEFAEWDIDLLINELNNVDDLYTGFTDKEIDDLINRNENRYTQKIETPVYEPKGERPDISELVDLTKFIELKQDIEKAELLPEVKRFLIHAATRHYVFNYSRIAEYYCHQTPEIQDLFERSALVIIDFEDAIEYEYVRLTKDLAKLSADDHE